MEQWRRPNKLKIKKVSTPIGVIGVIYESRPNVTADVAALCFKSRNCCILRGGSEAIRSNKILANLFRNSLSRNNIDKNCVQFIEKKDRKIVNLLLSKMVNYIDVIVPRGGKGLVDKVQKFSNILHVLVLLVFSIGSRQCALPCHTCRSPAHFGRALESWAAVLPSPDGLSVDEKP